MSFFGKTSKISAAINEVLYGLAVRWWTPSTQSSGYSAAPEPETIVSGTIERVDDMGGGVYRLVMRRGVQTFFYVVPPLVPGGGSIEVPYYCTMGGNICLPRDWQKGYSHLNAEYASRGSLMGTRVVPGDGVIINRDYATLPALVTAANAHSIPCDMVNYAGSVSLPRIMYTKIQLSVAEASVLGPEVRWYNPSTEAVAEGAIVTTSEWSGTALAIIPAGEVGSVRIDLDGTVEFTGELTGTYPSGLVLWADDVPTLATRQIFTPPGLADPDEDYLPYNFGDGLSGPKYWWDRTSFCARLTSELSLVGSQYELVWWVKTKQSSPGEQVSSQVAVESIYSDGPGATVDGCVLSGFEVGGDGTWEFTVYDGEGFVEWRTSSDATATRVTLLLGTDGPESASARDGIAETASALTFTPPSEPLTYPYQVQLTKVGENFSLSSRQSSEDSWELNASCTLTTVVEDTDGFVSSGTYGEDGYLRTAIAGEYAVTRVFVSMYADGSHAILRTSGKKTLTTFVDLGLASADLTQVYNLTTDTAMTEGSGTQRDQYRVIEGHIYAVVESSGDRWRITYAATGEAPVAPGRAPRPVSGQIERGWVELLDDPNPDFLPTPNVSANKANWHDAVTAKFEDGTVPVPGESVSFVRYGVFDPNEPPTLYWAIRDGDETEWQELSSEHYKAYWFAGLVLITQDWIDENVPAGNYLCLKAEGKVFKTSALTDAARWNELLAVAENLNKLYTQIPLGGWNESAMGGEFYRTIGVTAWNELGQSTAVGVGLSHSTYTAAVLPPADPPYTPGGPGTAPYWFSSPGIASTGFYDSVLRNGYVFDGVSPPESTILEGDGQMTIWPFPGGWYGGSPELYMGRSMPAPNNAYPADFIGAIFAVRGYKFSPNGIITNLPSAAVIEQAWIEATFSSLQYQQWSITQEIGPGLERYRVEYFNGTKVLENRVNAAGETTVSYFNDDWESVKFVDRGPVSFDLVGKRLDSANVRDWFGNIIDVPAHEYIGVGGGLSTSTAISDQSCLIDVTAPLNSLLSMRGSLAAYDSFELWPSFGASPETDADGISGIVRGMAPSVSYVQTGSPSDPKLTLSISGKWIQYSGLTLGPLLVRFRTGRTVLPVRPINMTPSA